MSKKISRKRSPGTAKKLQQKKIKRHIVKKTPYRLVLATILASFVLINFSFAAETVDRIKLTAKQSYVFKTYLKGDDINIQSKDGAVTLTGTVSEESNITLAQETVASLPGVESVDNQCCLSYSPPWLTRRGLRIDIGWQRLQQRNF